MSSMTRFTMAAAAVAAVFVAPVAADSVDCPDIPAAPATFASGLCRSLPEALDTAGMARTATEISSNEVSLAGNDETESVDLTFEQIRDDGIFKFCFGYCLTRNIEPELLARIQAASDASMEASADDRFAFAKQCVVDAGVPVFEDNTSDPGDQKVIESVPVPSNPIFFILPNNRGADFGESADQRAWWDNNPEKPLFSISGANPGSFDQLVLFQDGAKTVFAWEDITRTRPSGGNYGGLYAADEDFGDLVFTVDVVLNQRVPDGCPEGCESTSVAYNMDHTGQMASATSEGNCACLDFTC